MILNIHNLNKSFSQASNQIHVLQGVNLSLERGETVAIVGASGSGKSTLLSLISGLDRPDSGEIILDNQDMVNMEEADLCRFRARRIGIVFQQFNLIPHLKAFENVALPLEILKIKGAEDQARSALEQVGLGQRFSHYPHQMSGGEAQRVAIARAFAPQPHLLLADEPSGNLDYGNGLKVMDLLFAMTRSKKMTMILVTHNEQLAKMCDRQLSLFNGQLYTIRD